MLHWKSKAALVLALASALAMFGGFLGGISHARGFYW